VIRITVRYVALYISREVFTRGLNNDWANDRPAGRGDRGVLAAATGGLAAARVDQDLAGRRPGNERLQA